MLTDFLAVARSLEIMELIIAEPSNNEIVTNCKLKPATNLVTSDEEVVAPEFLSVARSLEITKKTY